MINLEDLKELNYFDEAFSPQDMDEHDLMFRMRKKLGKVCGCYWIDFVSDPSWGGTRKLVKLLLGYIKHSIRIVKFSMKEMLMY